MLELAEMIIDLCRSGSALHFLPLPVDDPTRRRPEIALAAQGLGWEPKTGIEEGLAMTIAYFRKLAPAGCRQ
jgi:nucleoside-diphosphate-sugar epimerase